MMRSACLIVAGPDGIASGDYRFNFRSAVFYLFTREKHLINMKKYRKVAEKKARFQDVYEDGFFCSFQRILMRTVRTESGYRE
jgi:hypothetical protein